MSLDDILANRKTSDGGKRKEVKISDLPQMEQECIKSCVDTAITTIASSGELISHALIFSKNPDGQECIDYVPPTGAWDNDENKREFAFIVRAQCILRDAYATALVSEAWVVALSTPEELKAFHAWKAEHYSLENFPGRREVVMIMLESALGRVNAHFKIHRPTGQDPYLMPEPDSIMFSAYGSPDWITEAKNGQLTMLYAPPELRTAKGRALAEMYLASKGAQRVQVTDELLEEHSDGRDKTRDPNKVN